VFDYSVSQLERGAPQVYVSIGPIGRKSRSDGTLETLSNLPHFAANIAKGFEYCANEEEGQMVEDVPVYDISTACTVM